MHIDKCIYLLIRKIPHCDVIRASDIPVHERLDRDALINKKEAQRRELEKIASEMEGLTFRPNLPVSTYLFECTLIHMSVKKVLRNRRRP